MKQWVILLRGVMPTGKNKVPMATLREVLSEAGFDGVKTWIQTGNILLKSDFTRQKLRDFIHQLILEHIGADIAVIVKTPEEIQQIMAFEPFPDLPPERVFYTLFNDPLNPDVIDQLEQTDFDQEKLLVIEQAVYLFVPDYSRGKLNNNFLERKLGIPMTTRNRNTLNKLIELTKK